ncbi:MAG: hypothetical protein WD826_01595 [Actinomycetota bacterium]
MPFDETIGTYATSFKSPNATKCMIWAAFPWRLVRANGLVTYDAPSDWPAAM